MCERNCGGDRGFVGDVQRERRHAITVSLHERGERIDVACRGGDPIAPREGRLSAESPVAVALLGREPGEQVAVSLPKGKRTLTVVSVS